MKVISFANQKGGSGKTTSSIAFATWVHSFTPLKVMVVDFDFQQSFTAQRQFDRNYILYCEHNKMRTARMQFYNQITEIKHDLFSVFSIPSVKENPNGFEELYQREKDNFDICLLDLPGSIESDAVDKVLGYINHIFIPTDVDTLTSTSSVDFGKAIMALAKKKHLPELLSIIYYFNKYTTVKNKHAFSQTREEISSATGLPFLENSFRDLNDVKMDISTIWPIKGSSKADHFLYLFCLEVIENIK